MSLLVKFNLVLFLVFALALVPAGYFTYKTVQRNARDQVIQDARIMMETAMAMRGYTIEQVKPLLQDRLSDHFLPQTVPAYSATEIFNNLRKAHPEYSYKEATLNPTNPRDRTVDWEADVVNAFRNDAARTEIIGERETPEGRSLYLSRPIRITDIKCLSCHSTPDHAPVSMIHVYGPNNGFGWQLGEVIGAQVVSVPMKLPVSMANTAFQALLVSLVGVFAFTLLVLNLLLRFVIIRPLRELSSMADQVSRGSMDMPDVVVPGRDEVAVLAGSFNRMRISLRKAMAMLDEA
jgi:HAMP domain-containing protein